MKYADENPYRPSENPENPISAVDRGWRVRHAVDGVLIGCVVVCLALLFAFLLFIWIGVRSWSTFEKGEEAELCQFVSRAALQTWKEGQIRMK